MNQSINQPRYIISSYDTIFWLIVIIGFTVIAISYPMMKLRFDIWDHVDRIKTLVLDPLAPLPSRRNWYACWAYVFRLLGINDIFSFATIIHRVQFILSCVLIYVAAKQIYSALLPLKTSLRDENNWLSSLALSSVFVWLTIIGTFSFFQQAWIMWYSVNYQITLPMLFLALGLTVNAFTVVQTTKLVICKVTGAFTLILGIYLFHAGELAYLIFYILIGILCFGSKFKFNWKYVLLGAFFSSLLLYVLVRMYSDHVPALITLLKNGEYAQILNDIKIKGKWNAIDGGNRFSANWNELYRFSVYLFMPVAVFGWVKSQQVNQRVLCFIGLSLAFCFIPTFQYSAGLASLISYDGIVNRYYFSSFVFIILPLFVYFILENFKIIKYPGYLISLVFLGMSLTLIYSKKINNEGVYFKNIQSIVHSAKQNRIDIGITDEFITDTGLKIKEIEINYLHEDFIYCGAYERLFVAKYIYRKENMRFDRLGRYSFAECEQYAKNLSKKIAYLN